MRGLIILLAAAAAVVLAALLGGPVLERSRRAAEMEALRTALDQARYSADSCKMTLAYQQEEFLRFDRRVDSLRVDAHAFEDQEQGGVPQAEYPEYLESFESYNSSVESWRQLADSLQASEAACRAMVEAHNYLGDSIRTRQEELMGGNR